MAGFVLVQDVLSALRCEWLVLPCATRSPVGNLPLNQKCVLLWKYWLPLDLTSQKWALLLGVEDWSRLWRLTVLQGFELPWYLLCHRFKWLPRCEGSCFLILFNLRRWMTIRSERLEGGGSWGWGRCGLHIEASPIKKKEENQRWGQANVSLRGE